MYYIVDDDLNIIDAVPEDYAERLSIAHRLAKDIKNSLDLQTAYKQRAGDMGVWGESQLCLNNYYYKMFAQSLLKEV